MDTLFKILGKKKRFKMDTHFLENIIADMPGVIFWKDSNSVYRGCNNTLVNIFGVKNRMDVIGKTDFDFRWSKEEAQRIINDDQEVIKTGIPKQNIYEHVPLPDGSYIDVLTNKVPLYNENEKIIGVLAVATDITEQKKAEQKLREAKELAERMTQAKSSFLATMSHELRTPLNGILGMAQVLMSKNPSAEQQEYIEAIEQSGKNLLELINDVLDFSKLEAGQVELHHDEFSPVKTAKDLVVVMQHVIQGKSIELKAEYGANLPECVAGDLARLRQILINLIGNAIKFTLEGHVTIKLNLISDLDGVVKIEFSIKDSGIGIPVDKLNTIFDRFTQVESEYSRRFEGSGLGLAIVKNLVEMMGGTITVQSEFGKGSTFTCILPFIKIEQDQANLAINTANAVKQLQSFDKTTQFNNYILVVEDNAINQTVMRAMLMNLGCRVDVAGNGKEAIKLYKEHEYDLIFMDIGLPDMDGLQVTKELLEVKKKLKRKHIPIVALTAHVMEDDRKNCLKVGMTDMLTKPIVHAQLVELLKRLIKPSKQN
jgi:PAS domain S-box-containing protein